MGEHPEQRSPWYLPDRLAHLRQPEHPTRPWWAVPLALVGLVAAAVGALTYRYGQTESRPAYLVVGGLLAVAGSTGLLLGWAATIRPQLRRHALLGLPAPHWPARIALLGAGLFLVGWWLHHSVAQQRLGCDLADVIGAIAQLVGDQGTRALTGCGSVRARYGVSIALLLLGPVLMVAALLFGMPYRTRRLARRLRISPEGLTVLTLALLLLAALAGRAAWSSHERTVELDARARAQHALTALTLPVELRPRAGDTSCQPTVDTRCARSDLDPRELEVALSRLLHGHRDDTPCRLIPMPSGFDCPLYVRGKIAGYPAVGWAFARAGKGSDVIIELVTPEDD